MCESCDKNVIIPLGSEMAGWETKLEEIRHHCVVVFSLSVYAVKVMYCPVQLSIMGWATIRGEWSASHNLPCGHAYYT